jgi:hypothetical protein
MWKALTVLSRCATTMVVRPGIKVSSVFCTTRSDVESSADVASSSSRIWSAAGQMRQVLDVPGLYVVMCRRPDREDRRETEMRQSEATFGSFRMARARAMRCFCPPDTCAPFSPACVSYLHKISSTPGIVHTQVLRQTEATSTTLQQVDVNKHPQNAFTAPNSPIWQLGDEVVCVCSACSGIHLLLRGSRAAVHDVVVDGGLEEARLLADQAYLPPQPAQGQLLDVDTIQGDLQVSNKDMF